MPLQIFHPDVPGIPLPPRHRFPEQKYRLLLATLQAEVDEHGFVFHVSPRAEREDLWLSHSQRYVNAVFEGTLTQQEQKQIALPWSETLLNRVRGTVGGSIAAARMALKVGCAGQVAGGTHHAHHDFGSGFCVFNDLAVATRVLQKEQPGIRVAILDLDVHQGDGNAALLKDDPNVFVASVHGARNFPFEKAQSDLDIGLHDGAGDEAYLQAVGQSLAAIEAFTPDIVLYISGVDPLEEDCLGRLAVSMQGLTNRDQCVLRFCQDRQWPIAIVIGGGYAEPISLTVEAYANTFRQAAKIFGSVRTSVM